MWIGEDETFSHTRSDAATRAFVLHCDRLAEELAEEIGVETGSANPPQIRKAASVFASGLVVRWLWHSQEDWTWMSFLWYRQTPLSQLLNSPFFLLRFYVPSFGVSHWGIMAN